MKGIQILTEKNKKEVKEHGSYTFPVQVSPEAIQSYEQHSFMWHWHPEIELTWFVSGQMEYVVNDQRYIISDISSQIHLWLREQYPADQICRFYHFQRILVFTCIKTGNSMAK